MVRLGDDGHEITFGGHLSIVTKSMPAARDRRGDQVQTDVYAGVVDGGRRFCVF